MRLTPSNVPGRIRLKVGTEAAERTVSGMDVTLRARARDGDPGAFEELFDGFARAVYNHACRLVGDWSLAEEVM